MSSAKTKREGEQSQMGLFGHGSLVANAAVPQAAVGVQRSPRVMSPVRNQVELCRVDMDALPTPDHPAHTVWAFVQAMDLAPLEACIKSAGSCGSASAQAIGQHRGCHIDQQGPLRQSGHRFELGAVLESLEDLRDAPMQVAQLGQRRAGEFLGAQVPPSMSPSRASERGIQRNALRAAARADMHTTDSRCSR